MYYYERMMNWKWYGFVAAFVLLLCSVESATAKGRPFITRWQGKVGEELKIPIEGENFRIVIKQASTGKVLRSDTVTIKNSIEKPYIYLPTSDGELILEAGPEGVQEMTMYNPLLEMFTNSGEIGSCDALLKIEQFGDVRWKGLLYAFANCKNMQFAKKIDKPDLSNVKNLMGMFSGCTAFNSPVNHWDVSKVEMLAYMFEKCTSFNQPLDKWNVSNVTSLSGTFSGCTSFNQPLNKWDVSKVTSMLSLFENCVNFNQPLDKWNVSNVTDMKGMFYRCKAFNQPLNTWNVSKVEEMELMFARAENFNQPLNQWDVHSVTNMESMFLSCSRFNQPLDKWDVSKVKQMKEIFTDCSAFDQNLGAWKLDSCQSVSFSHSGMSVENYSKTLVEWAKHTFRSEKCYLQAEGMRFDDQAFEARMTLVSQANFFFLGDLYFKVEEMPTMAFEPEEITLKEGEQRTLTLKRVGMGNEHDIDGMAFWSVQEDVVKIVDTKTMTIEAVKEGEGKVTILRYPLKGCGAIYAHCIVHVIPSH